MPSFKTIAKQKQVAVDELDDIIARLVLTVQEALRRKMINDLLPTFTLKDDKLANSIANQRRLSEVQDIFDIWAKKDGVRLADQVARSISKTSKLSEQYYYSTLTRSTASKTSINKAVDLTFKGMSSRYGISVGKKGAISARPGGYILSAVTNDAVSRSLQSVIQKSILTGEPIRSLKQSIDTALGMGNTSGILERNIVESLPSPALVSDRELNVQVSQHLELNFAFFQGGTIETTREFCDIRNNQVFSREEIAKFGTSADEYGGYTNKSAGEFQGKTKDYNPFVDLGGYNCRHSLDWISDELAKTFRPELFANG